MQTFIVEWRWKPVECSPGESYRFPSSLTSYSRKQYERPGIYRWAIFDSQGRLIEAYVGETENVHGRLYQYLRPGKTQQTNLRMKAYLDGALGRELRLEYQVLEFDDFQINSLKVSHTSLSDPHVRKFLEALVVSELKAQGCKILNMGKDSTDKQIEKAVKPLNLSADQKTELIKKFKSIAGEQVA